MSTKLFEKLKVYKNYSNDCILFKYIFDAEDINDENSKKPANELDTFRPEYTHQIFGDEEVIFGYKNLRIDYYLTPGLLHAYIGLKCKEKITPQRFDGIEPDDVFRAFADFGCSPGFTRNIDVFCTEKLKQDLEFVPFGTKLNEYTRGPHDERKQVATFEIYKVDSTMDEYESQKFIDYLDRVQTVLVFYIETSNFLDTDDPRWTHYFLYEKLKNASSPSGFRYATIGYLSVYNYYCYPDKMRSRVSQILIFPKYQNAGHGAQLVESVYKDVIQNSTILDITAESPSQEFIRLRDYVTTKMCCSLRSFRDKESLKSSFSSEMIQEAMKTYKIPKFQSRRCYEILRLAVTNQHNVDEWRNYRLFIKNRLNKPFCQKTKAARGACSSGESAAEQTNGEQEETSLVKNLKNRFGDAQDGETQIGFGSSSASSSSSSAVARSSKSVSFNSKLTSSSAGETQIGFGKPTSSKSVSFSTKVTSLNTSSSTTDKSSDSIDEDSNEKQTIFSLNESTSIFIKDNERKQLLEQQFNEAVEDYRRILKRLENENVSIN